jgi:hypothetical protein
MTPIEVNQNSPDDAVDVLSSAQEPNAQSSLRVQALGRSDDKPGIGIMCGGEEQAQHTWQEKLH